MVGWIRNIVIIFAILSAVYAVLTPLHKTENAFIRLSYSLHCFGHPHLVGAIWISRKYILL